MPDLEKEKVLRGAIGSQRANCRIGHTQTHGYTDGQKNRLAPKKIRLIN